MIYKLMGKQLKVDLERENEQVEAEHKQAFMDKTADLLFQDRQRWLATLNLVPHRYSGETSGVMVPDVEVPEPVIDIEFEA